MTSTVVGNGIDYRYEREISIVERGNCDPEETGYVRYTKWQWALSCVTKNATMYCHYETMNDGTSLGISSITRRNCENLMN